MHAKTVDCFFGNGSGKFRGKILKGICTVGFFCVTLPCKTARSRVAFAAIAQSVEHFIRNEKVVGSSPTRGSKRVPRGTLF